MKRVVLLHGLGNSAGVWAGAAAHWRPDLEIHTPELPWSGTGIVGWRHERDSARLVEEVLAAVPGGADLVVAHSFTSVLLLELLSRRALAADPLPLPGVALVNPFYRRGADDFRWGMIEPLLASFPATMSEGIRLQSGDRPIAADLRAGMARRLCEFVGPYGWLRFLDAYLSTPLIRLDAIATPCLVIGGDQDATADIAEARTLAAGLPAGRLRVLPGGGHFPMLERPEWFTGVLHAFLGGLDRPDAPRPPDRSPARLSPVAGI